MNWTPELQAQGRRNFMKALAGTPALAALSAGALLKGPVRGGPVRLGYIGVGAEGRVLLGSTDPAFGEVRAMCDINPAQLKQADEVLGKKGIAPPRHYTEWKEMLEKEDLEGIVIASPLWMHADHVVGCLEAGKHVLCEKMMAWDVAGCERMRDAARKTGRLLEIGYQRFYNPVYQAAYRGIVKAGLLGDVYHARLVWHRNRSWRRTDPPPSPDYDPSRWGYPTFDHLINWRLYWKYSQGLMAELASHQVNIVNWFFESVPEGVLASGGVYRFKDREVPDHVYATFEYPGGRTAVFTSIESNAFEDYYELYLGTKGTLILKAENEALLFQEGNGGEAVGVEVAAKGAGPVLESTESRGAAQAGNLLSTGAPQIEKRLPYKQEISAFCSAIRVKTPLLCGPDKAIGSARACIVANQAIEKKTRLVV